MPIAFWFSTALTSPKPCAFQADFTFSRMGFIYLGAVVDAFSRRVVGWSLATRLEKDLVIKAFDMAVAQRKSRGVIHHSDHGSQYTSIEFGKRCMDTGVALSMGSVGDRYDNSMAESFVKIQISTCNLHKTSLQNGYD